MNATMNYPAVETFESRVAERVLRGDSKASAIARVVASDPELHQRYVSEFNARSQGLDAPEARQDETDYIGAWDGLITQYRADGMSPAESIATATARYPALHSAYLRTYNERAAQSRAAR